MVSIAAECPKRGRPIRRLDRLTSCRQSGQVQSTKEAGDHEDEHDHPEAGASVERGFQGSISSRVRHCCLRVQRGDADALQPFAGLGRGRIGCFLHILRMTLLRRYLLQRFGVACCRRHRWCLHLHSEQPREMRIGVVFSSGEESRASTGSGARKEESERQKAEGSVLLKYSRHSGIAQDLRTTAAQQQQHACFLGQVGQLRLWGASVEPARAARARDRRARG